MGFYNQCGEVPLPFTEPFPDINALAEFVGDGVSDYYTGGTYAYTIDGTIIIWTWTWTQDPTTTECGAIAAANASEFVTTWSPFIPVEIELCPTCQEVLIQNCGMIILKANIPNGGYQVNIKDHQSGTTYMQAITFNASQGIWDPVGTEGVFTPFSVYTITILDETGQPLSWVNEGFQYDCIKLTFANFVDTPGA